MSVKKNNTYFQENNGKIYYYDNSGVKHDVPSTAFADLQEQIHNIGSPLTYITGLSAEQINELTGVKHGSVYSLLNEGTISGDGYSFDVIDGDEVVWTSGDHRWVQLGTNTWHQGPNISLENHTISGRDWTPDIEAIHAWRKWSEERGSSAAQEDNSVFIGINNESTLTAEDISTFNIGVENKIVDDPNWTEKGWFTQPAIAMNIGGNNSISGEGIAIGKGNSVASFGVAVGQGISASTGSFAFGQYSTADKGGITIGNSVTAIEGSFVAGCDGAYANRGGLAYGGCSITADYGAMAVGHQGVSSTSGAVAVGMNTVTASNNAIAFGSDGVTATNNAITVGMNGVSATQDAMAVGKCGVTAGPGGFAIGRNNVLSENGGFPVGMNGVTATYGSLAAGCNTVKAEDGSVAVGVDGVSADESVAVGRQGVYADEGAVAIGSNNISAFEGLAVGRQYVIADCGAVAIGTDNVSAAQGVSIGGNNVYTTYGGLSVGKDDISAAQSVSIGVNNIKSRNGGIALGHDYVSADGGGIAIGRYTSGVNGGHAFGYNAVAVDGSIAEGDFTSAGWGSVAIGQRANSIKGSVAIGWAENDRKYGSSYVSAFSDSYGKRALVGCQNFSEPLIVGYKDENNELKTFTVDSLVNGTVQLWVKNWQGYLFSTCRWYSPSYYNVTPMVFYLTFSSTNSQYNSSFEISARADGLFYTFNGVEQKVSASINNATQPIFNNAVYGFLKSDNTIAASTNDLTVTSYNVTGYTAYIDGEQKFVAARTNEDAARIAGDIDARNWWSYCESAIPASAISAQYVDINDICGGIGNIYADSRSVALNVNAEAYGNSFAVGKYNGTDNGYTDYYYQRVQFKDEYGSSTTHNYVPDIKVVLTRSTYNTIASGISIAMGLGTSSGAQAYGGSIALGTNTFAAGQSLGIGVIEWGGQVNATGNSLAIGGGISASGLGFTYGQNLTAVGESIAIGRNNKALYRALTIGGDNTATNNGVILGYGNTMSENYNDMYNNGLITMVGHWNHADTYFGSYSVLGNSNYLRNDYVGSAQGYGALMGESNTAYGGGFQTILGYRNEVMGPKYVMGYANTAKNIGYGVILGYNNYDSQSGDYPFSNLNSNDLGHAIMLGCDNRNYNFTAYKNNHNYMQTMSLIVGSNNTAYGSNLYALGAHNIVGSTVTAIANDSYNDGFALAFGYANTAVRNYDMALGYMSYASGGENLAFGNSTAIGTENISLWHSTAFGYNNIVGKGSRIILDNSASLQDHYDSCWPARNILFFDSMLQSDCAHTNFMNGGHPTNNILFMSTGYNIGSRNTLKYSNIYINNGTNDSWPSIYFNNNILDDSYFTVGTAYNNGRQLYAYGNALYNKSTINVGRSIPNEYWSGWDNIWLISNTLFNDSYLNVQSQNQNCFNFLIKSSAYNSYFNANGSADIVHWQQRCFNINSHPLYVNETWIYAFSNNFMFNSDGRNNSQSVLLNNHIDDYGPFVPRTIIYRDGRLGFTEQCSNIFSYGRSTVMKSNESQFFGNENIIDTFNQSLIVGNRNSASNWMESFGFGQENLLMNTMNSFFLGRQTSACNVIDTFVYDNDQDDILVNVERSFIVGNGNSAANTMNQYIFGNVNCVGSNHFEWGVSALSAILNNTDPSRYNYKKYNILTRTDPTGSTIIPVPVGNSFTVLDNSPSGKTFTVKKFDYGNGISGTVVKPFMLVNSWSDIYYGIESYDIRDYNMVFKVNYTGSTCKITDKITLAEYQRSYPSGYTYHYDSRGNVDYLYKDILVGAASANGKYIYKVVNGGGWAYTRYFVYNSFDAFTAANTLTMMGRSAIENYASAALVDNGLYQIPDNIPDDARRIDYLDMQNFQDGDLVKTEVDGLGRPYLVKYENEGHPQDYYLFNSNYIFGDNNSADFAAKSYILGHQNIIDYADFSFIGGTNNMISGYSGGQDNMLNHRSFIYGDQNSSFNCDYEAYYGYHVIFGKKNVTSGDLALAIGGANTAMNHLSQVFGQQNVSHGEHQFVIGKYNEELPGVSRMNYRRDIYDTPTANADVTSGALFIIGNGYAVSSEDTYQHDEKEEYIRRSNAFVVSANGVASAQTDVMAAGISLVDAFNTSTSLSGQLSEFLRLLADKPVDNRKYIIGCMSGELGWVEVTEDNDTMSDSHMIREEASDAIIDDEQEQQSILDEEI